MTTSLGSSETVRELFLETAHVVCDAIGDDAVGNAWTEPSVLEDQLVGGLAGHLARGGVWVVDEYLDGESREGRQHVDSAVAYFVHFVESADAEQHRQVRERGAIVAADGQDAIAGMVRSRLAALAERLPDEPQDRRVVVAQGSVSMSLDEYLKTRIVEQVVHLDDLARSVGRDPWPTPVAAQHLVIRIGCEIGHQRHGATEMIRCLYRSRLEPVLPVL
jgi:hypothetical protein